MNKSFFITIIHLVCFAQLNYSVSAFTLPAESSLMLTSPSSVVVLFAKKKKTKKSSPARSSTAKSGGAGFGSIPETTKASKDAADPTARVTAKTLLLQQAELRIPEPTPQQDGKTSKDRRKKWSQRNQLSSETDTLMTTYMEEFKQQQLRKKETPRPRRLDRVSKNPLIFTIDEFIDPEACQRVDSKGSGCFDLFYPESIADRLFNGQESEMDGLLFRDASSNDHNTKPGSYPDGIHMDTTNSCMFRHVTAILYLNDVPEECGGGTVFPLARALPNDPALAASRRLLGEKISHTRSKAAVGNLAPDARLIETRVGTNFASDPHSETAIRIQPKAGRLLVFFSRDFNGKEDPRAWHAGERIRDNPTTNSVTEKRLLNLFKQVDYNTDDPDRAQPSRAQTTFEAYLAPQIQEQQQWLQAIAQLSS